MKFTALLFAAGLLAFASQGQAVTVYSAALLAADGSPQDALITDASGNLLVSGFAGTGTFSIPDSQVQALVAQGTSASFAELASLFTPFGTDDFVNGTHTYFGTTQWGSYLIATEFVPTASQIGHTIYTFISNGSSLASGNEFALLGYGTITADPPAPNPPNAYNLGAAYGTILAGTAGTTTFSNSDLVIDNATVKSIGLAPVPETSVVLFGLLGMAGFVRRRR